MKNGIRKEVISPSEKIRHHHQHKSTRPLASSFEDSPAIIRSPQVMKQYYDFDYALQPHLDSAGAGPSKPSRRQPHPSSSLHLSFGTNSASGGGFLSLDGSSSTNTVEELQSQLESAVKPDEGESTTLSQAYQECLTTGTIRGPKRYSLIFSAFDAIDSSHGVTIRTPQTELDANRATKRRKISLTPDQAATQATLVKDSDLLGAWWGAMASNTFIGNGVPPLPFEPSSPRNRARFSFESNNKSRSRLRGKHRTYVSFVDLTLALGLMNWFLQLESLLIQVQRGSRFKRCCV